MSVKRRSLPEKKERLAVLSNAAPIDAAIYAVRTHHAPRDRFRTHRASWVINYFRITTVPPRLVYV